MNNQMNLILFSAVFLLLGWFGDTAQAQQDNRTIGEALGEENEDNSLMEEDPEGSSSLDQPEETSQVMEERSVFSVLFQLIIALAAVIAVMYVLLKAVNKRTRKFQSHQTVQNIGGVPLGQNKSVQLVKVGDRLLVVGVGDSIQLLKEIEDEREIAELLPSESAEYPWKQKGSALLDRIKKPVDVSSSDRTSSFSHLLEKQLAEMRQTRKKVREELKENKK